MRPELQAKLQFRSKINDHLRQLSVLLDRSVGIDELGPAERVLEMRKVLVGNVFPKAEWVVPFEERLSSGFGDYINSMDVARPGPIEILTQSADVCGSLTVPSLRVVSFDFPFDLNEGIISFVTSDWLDGLTLIWELEGSEQSLTIAPRGQTWASIDY